MENITQQTLHLLAKKKCSLFCVQWAISFLKSWVIDEPQCYLGKMSYQMYLTIPIGK